MRVINTNQNNTKQLIMYHARKAQKGKPAPVYVNNW